MASILEKINIDRRSDDHETREAADVMYLIYHQGTRPGSKADTKARVQAYGATTLQARHVVVSPDGSRVRLKFVGKEGVDHSHLIADADLAEMLKRRKAARQNPRDDLFDVREAKLREYCEKLDGGMFTPKDFRTARATTLAASEVAKIKIPKNEKDYKSKVKAVAEKVSHILGNKPSQALESYIDPSVFSPWRNVWT